MGPQATIFYHCLSVGLQDIIFYHCGSVGPQATILYHYVGSWRRSVNVAFIRGFSDARGCGRPPRFRTLVTGAQIAMCAALVFFPHFRRYTRRLRTCRSSLSLSQLGRALRGGCALLLPYVKRINMIREERVIWFVWNRRLDGGGGSLSLNGEIGQIPSSAIVTP